MRTITLAACATLAAALVAPAAATARAELPQFPRLAPATVTVASGTLAYRAGGRDRRLVTIRRAGDGELVIRDSSLILARAAGCRNVTFTEVRCSASAGVTRIRVTLNRPESRVRSKAPLPVGVRVS
jgi:hypothetical protein